MKTNPVNKQQPQRKKQLVPQIRNLEYVGYRFKHQRNLE
jgi:hypothetical protein